MADVTSIQSNIKHFNKDMTKYSLFLGGLNVKSDALEQYSPLKTGYARIFLVKMPVFMKKIAAEKTKQFKHLVEYGFVGVDGIQNTTMEFEQVTGGYAGRQFDVATVAKDETNEITVKLYEFAGSPVREFIDLWVTGISDPHTGIGHYHGALNLNPPVPFAQTNHTMEAIYVQTDATARADGIEYACMLANMMPKQVKKDHFNYEAGQHSIVQTDIPFTAVKYESPQINSIAYSLVNKYSILRDYLQFHSGYETGDVTAQDVTIDDWSEDAQKTGVQG
jgi:hypothetical protein